MALFTQRNWRAAGGIAIAVAALMAVFGVGAESVRSSKVVFLVYWGVFLVFLIAAIVCALLDLRYIRLQYALSKREIFKQTLGEEAFRKKLLAAEEQDDDEKPDPE